VSDPIESKLLAAIDDAFAPAHVESFLDDLRVRNARVWNIEEASSTLTPSLASSAYSKADKFETSFIDRYHSLSDASRATVKKHYEEKVLEVDPGIKDKYKKLFGSNR
jgi:hypothetical protein